MKKLVIASVLLLGACKMIPPMTKTLYTDNDNRVVYSITCSSFYGLGHCYEKAHQACPNGFKVIDKSKKYKENENTLIFKCN